MSAAHSHGCCADKACSDKTCMELPAGKTCGDCSHIRHCVAFYAHTPTDSYCDFFPRRFVERVAVGNAAAPALTAQQLIDAHRTGDHALSAAAKAAGATS